MRMLTFSKRCAKEILRDPINLFFGLGFPIVLLLLLSAMQANIPVDLFAIESLAPGIAVFGLAFITLFSATLVSKDRESSLLSRLYTTPLSPSEFIFGYAIPVLPIALAQSIACYLIALPLGLTPSVNLIYALLAMIPIAILYVSLGLLFGSILTSKQAGGVCGALLTNLSAWLSGVWFDLKLMGDGFAKIAKLLPFVHAVELERAVISGDFSASLVHLYPVLAYAIATSIGAVLLFLRQMKRQ